MSERLRRPRLVNRETYDGFKQFCKDNKIPLKEGLERAMVHFQKTGKVQRRLGEFEKE
ncbi:MAG: hypothetical protein ACXQT3_01775 [Methermicoccaceae archaeon]